MATFGRGRGRSSKGKGRLGGRKGSAKPWSSLQTDKPPAEWFPMEVEAAFMASVRLKTGVSLLVDTGSPGNLCGDEWSHEMATESTSKVDRAPEYKKRDRTLTCRGVGTGSQSSDWDVRHTIALGTGRLDTFTAPELPDSCVPGILGQNSMENLRVLIDTFTGIMYMVGPGGYELRLSPGSEKHDLQKSSMGHLMLPCSNFGPQKGQNTDETMNFVVGEYFASEADEARWNDDWEEFSKLLKDKPATSTPSTPSLPKTRRPGARAAVDQSCSATTPNRVGTHSAGTGSDAASS